MKNQNVLHVISTPVVCVAVLCLLSLGCGSNSHQGNLPVATAYGAGSGVAGQGRGPAPVSLGTSANYAILAESTITSVPTSVITGNVGLSPAAEMKNS